VARTGILRCSRMNAILAWRWFEVAIFFCSCFCLLFWNIALLKPC
jgi:hypothetical protein